MLHAVIKMASGGSSLYSRLVVLCRHVSNAAKPDALCVDMPAKPNALRIQPIAITIVHFASPSLFLLVRFLAAAAVSLPSLSAAAASAAAGGLFLAWTAEPLPPSV